MADMLGRISNQQKVREGVGLIVDFKNSIPDQYKDQLNPYINNVILKGIADKRAAKGEKELADWIMTQAK
jgi:aminopeptidase N